MSMKYKTKCGKNIKTSQIEKSSKLRGTVGIAQCLYQTYWLSATQENALEGLQNEAILEVLKIGDKPEKLKPI